MIEYLVNYWYDDAKWYQIWKPESGWLSGVFLGFITGLVFSFLMIAFVLQ